MEPVKKCEYCSSTEHIDYCRSCMRPVCPNHRWGTGDRSDGYRCTPSCVEGSSSMAFIMGPERRPFRWWRSYLGTSAMVIVFAVVIIFLARWG